MLNAIWTGPDASSLVVVFLHGFTMRPADLVPFATPLASDARFAFPEGPALVPPLGRSWWDVDFELRAASLSQGPRDLACYVPPGLTDSRRELSAFLRGIRLANPWARLVLGGFSQGGMLACDLIQEDPHAADGLVLCSSSRVDFRRWQSTPADLGGKPILVAHGRRDQDISFNAGVQLMEWLRSVGADVTWLAFDGGHEMPLPVWRAIRRFLQTSM